MSLPPLDDPTTATVTASGGGFFFPASTVTFIQKRSLSCFEASIPASAGHQPNQFHPNPIHCLPFATNSRPVVPLRPTFALASRLTLQLALSWQSAQPLADL